MNAKTIITVLCVCFLFSVLLARASETEVKSVATETASVVSSATSNVVPQLQKVISLRLNVPMRSVLLPLVMHHYAEYWVVREGHTGGASYYLKILVDGNDVTEEFNPEELFQDIIKWMLCVRYWIMPGQRVSGIHI